MLFQNKNWTKCIFFLSYIEENIPINDFPWKKNFRFTLFLLINIHICLKTGIFRKILEIKDDHNFGTEYARDMKFVSKCVVLDTLLYSAKNSILTKSWFRPFSKWALHILIYSYKSKILH